MGKDLESVVTYPRMSWWLPPSNADWFDLTQSATINSTTPATLVDFTLPDTDRGIIRWFGQTIMQSGVDNLVTWQVTLNGVPDRSYGKVVGLISTLVNPTDTLIRIPKGTRIKLIATTTSITNIDIIGRLKGWSWTEVN